MVLAENVLGAQGFNGARRPVPGELSTRVQGGADA